jgi:Homeodomain-like domain
VRPHRRPTLNKKYRVELTTEQRQALEALIRKGNASAHAQTHARILLKADTSPDGPAWSDAAIAEAVSVSVPTVERVRRACVTAGLPSALYRQKWTGPSRRKLDGAQEAQLIALACGDPPEGAERWTLLLLADKLVALGVVESIAPDTVRLILKKTNLSLG